ncbi:MAG TPA: MFS transporter [Thermomicrobiales bacterium]|nr:MFS transporter [Thermomicrobiales bacterium]
MARVQERRQESVRPAEQPMGDDGMLHSLQVYPLFRRLMLGTLGSSSGFWMYQVAIGWLALDLINSPLFVGLAGFAGGIPMLLLSIPAGVVIDRYNRRNVLLMAQAGVAIVSTIFAILVATDTIAPWSLLVLVIINGSVMSFIFPVRTAMVPSLVERHHLANAVALMSATQNATRVVGPSLAGILIAVTGISGTFVLAAVFQGLALLGIWGLPSVRPEPKPAVVGESRFAQLMVGFKVVARSPVLLSLCILALAPTVLVMPYLTLMPVFARDVFGLGATGLGILLAAAGLGTVMGALAVARSRRLMTMRGGQVLTAVGFAISVAAFALAPSVWLAVPLLLISGWMSAAFLAINQTLVQLNVDDEVRGRVMSVSLLTWGVMPFGQLALGAVADAVGAPVAMAWFCLVAILCVVVIAIRFPQLR